jgi:hypothetical protein
MSDDGPGLAEGTLPENPPKTELPFDRFLHADSAWPWRAWMLFVCALVFCTMQALPSWTHPDLYLGLDRSICFWIIGISGALTGLVVARYPGLGLVAGALAGSGSLLAAVLALDGVGPVSRLLMVTVEMIGLLPGVAFYCVSHLVRDRLTHRHPAQR